MRPRGTIRLLICGVALGPLFIATVLLQALTRPGFDIRRVPLSLLSLGDLGWIQVANFVLTGLLAVACAIGMRSALENGRGGTWGPGLIASHGLGLVLAGIFHPDPGLGFPPGVKAPPTISLHGALHNVSFLLVVLSLVAACFVFSRTFGSRGWKRWRAYSFATGLATPFLIVVAVASRNFSSVDTQNRPSMIT